MKKTIFTGLWGNCHIQGIAVDKEKGFIYYSFTTKLVKATLDGEIVGTVDGLLDISDVSRLTRKTERFTALWNTKTTA